MCTSEWVQQLASITNEKAMSEFANSYLIILFETYLMFDMFLTFPQNFDLMNQSSTNHFFINWAIAKINWTPTKFNYPSYNSFSKGIYGIRQLRYEPIEFYHILQMLLVICWQLTRDWQAKGLINHKAKETFL